MSYIDTIGLTGWDVWLSVLIAFNMVCYLCNDWMARSRMASILHNLNNRLGKLESDIAITASQVNRLDPCVQVMGDSEGDDEYDDNGNSHYDASGDVHDPDEGLFAAARNFVKSRHHSATCGQKLNGLPQRDWLVFEWNNSDDEYYIARGPSSLVAWLNAAVVIYENESHEIAASAVNDSEPIPQHIQEQVSAVMRDHGLIPG